MKNYVNGMDCCNTVYTGLRDCWSFTHCTLVYICMPQSYIWTRSSQSIASPLNSSLAYLLTSCCREVISHARVTKHYNPVLERCNPWLHVANCHVSISQLLSLWRQSHYDVISHDSRLRPSQPPFSLWRHSHHDIIRYWAGHAQCDGWTYGHSTTFNI